MKPPTINHELRPPQIPIIVTTVDESDDECSVLNNPDDELSVYTLFAAEDNNTTPVNLQNDERSESSGETSSNSMPPLLPRSQMPGYDSSSDEDSSVGCRPFMTPRHYPDSSDDDSSTGDMPTLVNRTIQVPSEDEASMQSIPHLATQPIYDSSGDESSVDSNDDHYPPHAHKRYQAQLKTSLAAAS